MPREYTNGGGVKRDVTGPVCISFPKHIKGIKVQVVRQRVKMEKAELEHIQVGETDEALVTLQKLDLVDQPEVTDEERRKVKRMMDIRW